MVQLLLNFVVFISGAVLMSLEIVGSRVLAPNFGSSIFVWGSLISVVMAALSIGYYWGGWLSAREPSYGKLLVLLLIPGILIFFLPFLYPAVNDWIAGDSSKQRKIYTVAPDSSGGYDPTLLQFTTANADRLTPLFQLGGVSGDFCTTLANLTDGNLGQSGVTSLGVTNALYADVDGNPGFDAPLAP